jgi:hypothetical protein
MIDIYTSIIGDLVTLTAFSAIVTITIIHRYDLAFSAISWRRSVIRLGLCQCTAHDAAHDKPTDQWCSPAAAISTTPVISTVSIIISIGC